MDVVHHLMDDAAYQQAFLNCARLLRPGGYLIFTDNFLHGPAYRGPHHVSRSLIHIEQVLRAADLRIEHRSPMFVLMNNPIDSRSELFKFYWRGMNFAVRNHAAGACAGMLLYPFELLLTSTLKEGPSTEIAIARKR
jgi:SAM-dependent methyltransferase